MKLFISFCGADFNIKNDIKSRMEELISFYRAKNIDLEIIEMDTHCPGDWGSWMIKAVDSSDCVIAILTDNVFHANVEKRVYEEIVEARNKGITRIPFIITNDSELPEHFRSNLNGCSAVYLSNQYSDLEYKEKLDELFLKTKNSLEDVYNGFVSEPELLPSYMEITPSDIFIGREKEMEDIKKMFDNSNLVILQGQGGIGKTCLAKNFFFKYKDLYSKAYIVSAPNGIKDAIANLDLINVYQGAKDLEEKYKSNLIHLSKLSEKIIIVLDNVDCGISKQEINNLINLHCRFIITSRPEFDSQNLVKEIGPMTDEDLVKLIYAKHPSIEIDNKKSEEEFQKGILNLIEYAGRHTLTLEMAASIMKSGDISLDEICEKLLTITDKCRTEHTDEKLTIFERLSTLYNLVDLTDEHKKILYAMTLISPQIGIERKELKKLLELENNEAINELAENTFIHLDRNTKVIKMHSLFSDVIFKKEKVFEDVFCINEDIVEWLTEIEIDENNLKDITSKLELLRFIDQKRKHIFKDMDIEIQCGFLITLSSLLASVFDITLAITSIEECIEIAAKSEEEYFIAVGHLFLGDLYFGKSDLNKAESSLLTAYSISKELGSKNEGYGNNDSKEILDGICNSLATLYRSKGDFKKAEEYYSKISKEREDTEDIDIENYNNIGALYLVKGDYDKAEEYLLKAKCIADINDSETDDDITSNLLLGRVYLLKGDIKKAEEYLLKAQSINEKVYAEYCNHPNLTLSYIGLGELYLTKGDYEKAEKCLLKAQSINEKVYAEYPNHVNLAISYGELGVLYLEKGDYEKAEGYLLKSDAIFERIFVDNLNQPNVLKTIVGLGRLYLNKNDYDKAEEYLLKSKDIAETIYVECPNTPDLILTYDYLGTLYTTTGNYGKAEEYLLKANSMTEKDVEDSYPWLTSWVREDLNQLKQTKKEEIEKIISSLSDVEGFVKEIIRATVENISYSHMRQITSKRFEIDDDAIAQAFNGVLLPPNSIDVNVIKTLDDIQIVDYICERAYSYMEANKNVAKEAREKYHLDLPENLFEIYSRETLKRVLNASSMTRLTFDFLKEQNINAIENFDENTKNLLMEFYKKVLKYITHTRIQIQLPKEEEDPMKGLTTNEVKDESVKKKPVEKKEHVGPDDLCPCGSGKKYKFCHGII